VKTRKINMKSNEMLEVCFKGKKVLLIAIGDSGEDIQLGHIGGSDIGYDWRECTRKYLESMSDK
jgi:hypothetical protein